MLIHIRSDRQSSIQMSIGLPEQADKCFILYDAIIL